MSLCIAIISHSLFVHLFICLGEKGYSDVEKTLPPHLKQKMRRMLVEVPEVCLFYI